MIHSIPNLLMYPFSQIHNKTLPHRIRLRLQPSAIRRDPIRCNNRDENDDLHNGYPVSEERPWVTIFIVTFGLGRFAAAEDFREQADADWMAVGVVENVLDGICDHGRGGIEVKSWLCVMIIDRA